jgi:hypothetical protein
VEELSDQSALHGVWTTLLTVKTGQVRLSKLGLPGHRQLECAGDAYQNPDNSTISEG